MSNSDEKSPLVEASPMSLDEIFSADPGTYGPKETAVVVRELREMSARWNLAEAAGKKSLSKKEPLAKPKSDISLADIFSDIK